MNQQLNERYRRILNHLNIFTTCLLFFSTQWVIASDFHSPRTDGLGGAGHASPLLTDAIYLNPSFSSFVQTHALSFDYMTYCCGTIPNPGGSTGFYGHNLNISVLDGSPESLFQAGVGYTRREDSAFLHIGASKSIVQKIGVGIGTKFIFPNESSGQRITDGTLSVSGLVSSLFQSSLIVDNLFEAGTSRGLYREFIVGTKFNLSRIILIYLDPHWIPNLPTDHSKYGYEAGAELPLISDIFFRIGMFKNSVQPYQSQVGNGYGLGVGWLAPKLSLDYAFSRVLTPFSLNSHNFQFTIYF